MSRVDFANLRRSATFKFVPPEPKLSEWREAVTGKRGKQARTEIRARLANEVVKLWLAYQDALDGYGAKRLKHAAARGYLAVNAAIIAERCLQWGVSPVDVIEHWHEKASSWLRIRHVPFATLKSNAAMEEIASRKGRSGPGSVDQHHSFANPSLLHPAIRPALEMAGIKLDDLPLPGGKTGWGDEHLLTAQAIAFEMLAGRSPSASPLLRDLADVAYLAIAAEKGGA